MSESLLIKNARVLADHAPDRADVLIAKGLIEQVGSIEAPAVQTIDARGRVLMPAFIDAHTHACWAGERLDEYDRQLAGATYLEILEAGGGIMSTVRAVRAATQSDLRDALLARLGVMLREGTTTVEVKSGYGLTAEHELKMLRAITDAGERWAGTVVPTACIGHALEPGTENEQRAIIERTITETLDAVHAEFPDVTIDAYCEKGAWSLADCERLFERAMSLGHPVRVHADQFNSLGMIDWAVANGVRSIDHLEATSPNDLRTLAQSDTFGVMLPCSGLHLDQRYADGRTFLDAGGKLVIATNCNPGSAPTSSMPFAIAMATRGNRITAREAIDACTANAAVLLGFEDRGIIAVVKRADLILLRHTDERALGHEFGGNPVDLVVCDGRVVDPA
ncbi:MAG: imidazolonepropionase [Planctomycetota bacterium]